MQTEKQFGFIISEMEKELTIQEELRSNTTETSDLSDLDGEFVSEEGSQIYQNTPFQESRGSSPPPAYSVNTADAILDKLRAGVTDDEVTADILQVEDYSEMEKLTEQFSDWVQRSTTDAQRERFKELHQAAYNRLILM